MYEIELITLIWNQVLRDCIFEPKPLETEVSNNMEGVSALYSRSFG